MKSLFALFCTLMSLTAIAQEEVDCEKFRTGKFKYEDPNFGLIIVKRDKDSQVEINADKVEIHSSVKWLSDCKFVLTHTKVENAEIPELIGEKVYVEIISNKGNRYICRATTQNGYGGEIEVLKID